MLLELHSGIPKKGKGNVAVDALPREEIALLVIFQPSPQTA
jgi:hypothetical protein